MSYAQAQADIAAANLPDDASKVAFAGATIYSWSHYFASYRTIYDLLLSQGDADPDGTVKKISAAITAQSPVVDAMLKVPGDSKGNGGGADLASPLAQSMLAGLVTANVITQAQADSILDLARSSPRPRYKDWGFDSFDETALTKLPLYVAWEALGLDVDLWSAAISQNPAVIMSLANIDAATLASRRDAMSAAVQTWKTTIDSGGDASKMPQTAAALWASLGS